MKDIVKLCRKTNEETAKSSDETQIKLNQNLNKDEYGAFQNTIQINKKANKKILQHCKFKKYNLNTVQNLPGKQITFKKTMKTGRISHTLKLQPIPLQKDLV